MPSIFSAIFTLIIEDIQVWGFFVLFVLESILFQSQMCIYHLYKEEGQGRTMRSFISFPGSKGKEPDQETQTHEHTIWRVTQETLRKRGFGRQMASWAFCPRAEIVKISPCSYPPLAIICFMVLIIFNYAISHSIYFLYLSYNLTMLYTYIYLYIPFIF